MPDTAATTRAERVRAALSEQRAELLALVRRQGGPAIDADEVVQVACERALARSHQLRDGDRVGAWLARIARNAAIDDLRRRRPSFIAGDHVEQPFHAHRTLDCWCVLAQAALLKAEYVAILKRVDIDGVAVTEVASTLGLSANNAMVRLHRARKALRARMAAHCGTTSSSACSACGCLERRCCARP